MKEVIMKKVRAHGLIFLVLMMALGISGCATTGIYSIDIGYNAEKAVVTAYLKPDQKTLQ
jgi:hypothetical protein